MNNVPSDSTQKILNILEQASSIVLKYFNTELAIEYKKDEFDPVTLADKESDEFIRKSLHNLFPNDLLLSEENPTLPETYTGRVWMIDPLDGTRAFVKGSDTFSINIGLVEDGTPIFGCVAVPAQKKILFAEKTKGVFEKIGNTFKPMHTSLVTEIQNARLITRETKGDIRPIEEKLNTIQFLERFPGGSVGDKLSRVAAGLAEVHINTNNRISKWDTAASQIILEEAGGVLSDLDGKPIDYKTEAVLLGRSFVASANKELHDKIIAELINLKV
jgi:3'(2'), 5'-bisphosphate nucleotidase